MAQSERRDSQPSAQDVALIVGGGPGISASCARLFAQSGMRVGIAARTRTKRSCWISKRRMACADTRPTLAIQRPWTSCSSIFSRPGASNACGAQHRRPGSRRFRQEDHRSRSGHGARHASQCGVQRVFGRSAGGATYARKQPQRQWRQGDDHLYERECGAQGVPGKRCLCDGVPCEVRTCAEHGKRIDAARYPRSESTD